MSFLFLMIKIALVIYVVKFVCNVAFGLLALRSANKTDEAVAKLFVMANNRTVEASAKEVK